MWSLRWRKEVEYQAAIAASETVVNQWLDRLGAEGGSQLPSGSDVMRSISNSRSSAYDKHWVLQLANHGLDCFGR
jgi:hypothetical protein